MKIVAKICLVAICSIIWIEYHTKKIKAKMKAGLSPDEEKYLDETNLFI